MCHVGSYGPNLCFLSQDVCQVLPYFLLTPLVCHVVLTALIYFRHILLAMFHLFPQRPSDTWNRSLITQWTSICPTKADVIAKSWFTIS